MKPHYNISGYDVKQIAKKNENNFGHKKTPLFLGGHSMRTTARRTKRKIKIETYFLSIAFNLRIAQLMPEVPPQASHIKPPHPLS
jgi:hypothetical protein